MPSMNDILANHDNHAAELIEKLNASGGVKIDVDPTPKAPAAPAVATPEEAPPTVAEAAPEEAPPAAEAAPSEAPAPAAVAPPAAAKPNKLGRSLEIQRRAEAAVRQARAEAGKLRAPAPPVAAAPQAPDAKEVQAFRAEQARLGKVQAQLDAEIRLAKTDPLGFASRHGVSGAAIAEYVRAGKDPNTMAIEQLRREAGEAIAQIRQEHSRELDSLKQSIAATNEAQVQRNFFEFVEEAKMQDPSAFAALNSGLIYSDKEVWDKANALLESRADLRDNFDEDKLLEAVEAEARKETRWAKVQKLLPTSAPVSTPNAAVGKSNARAREEATAVPAQKAKAEAAPRPATPRDPNGQFVRSSPLERHQLHVEQVLQRTKLGF